MIIAYCASGKDFVSKVRNLKRILIFTVSINGEPALVGLRTMARARLGCY